MFSETLKMNDGRDDSRRLLRCTRDMMDWFVAARSRNFMVRDFDFGTCTWPNGIWLL